MGTIYRNGVAFVGSGGAGGVEMTQAEYEALPSTEKMNGTIYFITDGDVSYPSASQMRYDNTESQIPSTTVQGAIDENRIEINDLKTGLTVSSEIINSTYASGVAYKWGRVVTVVINNGDAGSVAANTVLTTLPVAYRPANIAEFVNTYAKNRIRIDIDGSIIAVEAINSSYVRGCVTYIAAS